MTPAWRGRATAKGQVREHRPHGACRALPAAAGAVDATAVALAAARSCARCRRLRLGVVVDLPAGRCDDVPLGAEVLEALARRLAGTLFAHERGERLSGGGPLPHSFARVC